MVLSLGPGKFYGTSLPRPWIYTDVKFNDHRVDPPPSVTDPLMSWAQEAHWSMGGLSFTRLRLQGKIEGNVEKLRSQRDNQSKAHSPLPQARSSSSGSKRPSSASPPPAPVATKCRRFMALLESVEEEKENQEDATVASGVIARRRGVVKKLGDDFDRVASENEGSDSVALKSRRRRLVKLGDAVKKVVEEEEKLSPKENKKINGEAEKSPVSGSGNGVRTSPRLAKRVAN